MQFAPETAAQAFLTNNPDIELFELFILDANGVPRGKLLHREELPSTAAAGHSPAPFWA
jgi:glutamine synthetase